MAIKFDRNTVVFDVVATGLKQCTSLTFLRFRGIMMTSVEAECLAGVLGQCPALADLDLRCTDVGALVPRDVGNKEVFVPYGETLLKRGGVGGVAILARGLMQNPCP